MTISDQIKKEIKAYEKGPFDDLAVQDALIIIAVYAAQVDPEDCDRDVKRIEKIAENRPEFVEKRKDLFSRIYTYINSMSVMGPEKALQMAAEALNSAQRNAAFDLAVEVALPDGVPTDEKKAMLDNIATALSIDREFAQHRIEKFTG